MAAFRRVGRLRHRVQCQEPTATLDSLGRKTRGQGQWSTYTSRWAEVRELSGREVELARQIHAQASHIVTVRYFDRLSETHRFVFRGRVLEIKAILDKDSTQRELSVLCGEEK